MDSADRHRQRVIVVSPFGQHVVDILVDVPASGLLPDLLAMAGLHPSQVRVGSGGWRLEDAQGNAVPPGNTLAQYGVRPGDVIQLCGLQHPEPAGDPVAEGADRMTPLQRTEAALPSKAGQLRRGSAAIAAFFQGPGSPAAAHAGDAAAAERMRARPGGTASCPPT
jgi:WXG100 protein secretion system (Wss), protein YukD